MGGSGDNCSLLILLMVAASCVVNARVTTKFGDIRGVWSRSSRGRLVTHYLGIPYARPPLGHLRFRVRCLLYHAFARLLSEGVAESFFFLERFFSKLHSIFFHILCFSVTEPPAVGWNVERDFRGYEKCPTVLSDVEEWEHDGGRRLSLSQCLRAKSERRKRGKEVESARGRKEIMMKKKGGVKNILFWINREIMFTMLHEKIYVKLWITVAAVFFAKQQVETRARLDPKVPI